MLKLKRGASGRIWQGPCLSSLIAPVKKRRGNPDRTGISAECMRGKYAREPHPLGGRIHFHHRRDGTGSDEYRASVDHTDAVPNIESLADALTDLVCNPNLYADPANSDAKKETAQATSSGRPIRPSGIVLTNSLSDTC